MRYDRPLRCLGRTRKGWKLAAGREVDIWRIHCSWTLLAGSSMARSNLAGTLLAGWPLARSNLTGCFWLALGTCISWYEIGGVFSL